MRILLLIFLSFFSHAFAKVEHVELVKDKKVIIDLPQNWEHVEDLFGVPMAVLGPWEDESRPVILYTPTGVKSDKMPEATFQQFFKDFKKEKEEWVKSRAGELTKFDDVTSVQYRGAKGFYIGAEFVMNDINFYERSFYLYCKNELYNVKWSLREEHKKYLPELQLIVENFQCE